MQANDSKNDDIQLGCNRIFSIISERQPHVVILLTQQGLCLSDASVSVYLNESVLGSVISKSKRVHKISAPVDLECSHKLIMV